MKELRIPDESDFIKKTYEADFYPFPASFLVLQAEKIADFLLDDEGAINKNHVDIAIKEFSKQREVDLTTADFFGHVRNLLQFFLHDYAFWETFHKKVPLLASSLMEQFVAITARKKKAKISYKVRKTLLVSLLVPLRQTVGSCFATSVLIILQKERPLLVLQDLQSLLFRGYLQRVEASQATKIQASKATSLQHLYKPLRKKMLKDPLLQKILAKWNIPNNLHVSTTIFQSLQDVCNKHALDESDQWLFFEEIKSYFQPPLLKCWEYTASSFVKEETSPIKTKLLVALGMHNAEKSGFLQEMMLLMQETFAKEEKLYQDFLEQIQETERDIHSKEAFFHQSSRMDQLKRLGRDIKWQSLHHENMVRQLEEIKEQWETKEKLMRHIVTLIEERLPWSFLELYDPDKLGTSEMDYDTKARFRLVYRGESSNPLLWQAITCKEDFIRAIHAFLTMIENQVRENHDFVEKVFTQLHIYVSSLDFYEKAEKNLQEFLSQQQGFLQFENLWTFVSGGSIESFITGFLSGQVVEKEVIHSKNVEELFFYLLELMKGASMEKENQRWIISAHQHAFVFEPMRSVFKEQWEKRSENTYSQIKKMYLEKKQPIIFADSNWPYYYFAFFADQETARWRLLSLSERGYEDFTPWAKGEWTLYFLPLKSKQSLDFTDV